MRMQTAPSTWIGLIGHVPVELALSAYPSGQPRLDMVVMGCPEVEELTIEIPGGFDLRAYDADFGFSRLHLTFRSEGRAQLFIENDLVRETPHAFTHRGQPVLPIVYIPTPKSWALIRAGRSASHVG